VETEKKTTGKWEVEPKRSFFWACPKESESHFRADFFGWRFSPFLSQSPLYVRVFGHIPAPATHRSHTQHYASSNLAGR
jgi:hypothetical protein